MYSQLHHTNKTQTKMTKKLDNFLIGCAIFAGIALVLSMFLPFYVGARTRDKTQKGANMCMACGLSWLALFFMWITWSTFYQAQVYPYLLITPEAEKSE